MHDFVKILTPVLAANALTLLFVYSVMRLDKGPRLQDILLALLPLAVAIYGLYLWGFTEATPFRHLLAGPQSEMPLQ